MKNILFFTILVFLFCTAGSQTTDYLQKKEFQTEKKKIYDNIDAAKKPASDLKKMITRQSLRTDSLGNLVKTFGTQNAIYADSINKMSARVAFLNDQVCIAFGCYHTHSYCSQLCFSPEKNKHKF